MEEKKRISVFHIEDAGLEETEAMRIEVFPGTDPEEASVSFTTVVFKNSLSLLYKKLQDKLGKEESEWYCDAEFSDCIKIAGDAKRIAVPKPFYRYERNKKGVYVKATPARIVRYAKLVEIAGGPTFQEQLDRYLANVPDDCWIEEEGEEGGE